MFIGECIILVLWNLVYRNIRYLIKTIFEVGVLDVITLDAKLGFCQIECIFHPVCNHFVNSWNGFANIVVYPLRLVILIKFASVLEVHTCRVLQLCFLASHIKRLTTAILHDSCFGTLSSFNIDPIELKMVRNTFKESCHKTSLKISRERNLIVMAAKGRQCIFGSGDDRIVGHLTIILSRRS